MTDIKETLRDYLEASQPVTLDETFERVTPPVVIPIAQRPRPVLTAAAAAVIVLLLVGGVWLLTADGTSPVVTQPSLLSSTIPPATTQPAPSTTQTLPIVTPAEVSGSWALYSSDQGLPTGGIGGVAVGPAGTAWAAPLGSPLTLYRFDGIQWSQVGDPLVDTGGYQWMAATPGGGVAMSVPDGDQAYRIVRFDGDQWVNETDDIIYISALVSGGAGPRILGYDTSDNLVDIRFTDGGVSVKTASRDVSSGVSASFATISDTVDVDSEGIAWYGSVEGAWRFDGDSLELFEFGVQGDCCAPLAVDEHDNVWIQLAPHGDLFRLSPSGERTKYTPEDGIPFLRSGEGLTIVPTSDGSVWVVSRGGVARFDGVTWMSYTIEEAQAAGIPTMRSHTSFGVFDGPDGSTWTVQLTDTEPSLNRFLDGQWMTVPTTGISWGPVGADRGTLGLAVGPDGSLWSPSSTGVAHCQADGE